MLRLLTPTKGPLESADKSPSLRGGSDSVSTRSRAVGLQVVVAAPFAAAGAENSRHRASPSVESRSGFAKEDGPIAIHRKMKAGRVRRSGVRSDASLNLPSQVFPPADPQLMWEEIEGRRRVQYSSEIRSNREVRRRLAHREIWLPSRVRVGLVDGYLVLQQLRRGLAAS